MITLHRTYLRHDDLGWTIQQSFATATGLLSLFVLGSPTYHLTASHNHASTTSTPNTLVKKHEDVQLPLQRPRPETQPSRTQAYMRPPILHTKPWSLTFRHVRARDEPDSAPGTVCASCE